MKSRTEFSQEQITTIKTLISNLKNSNSEEQKKIRRKIRELEFYISDFKSTSNNENYTVAEFNNLIKNGIIKVIGKSTYDFNKVQTKSRKQADQNTISKHNSTVNNAIKSSDIDSPRYDFNTKSKANKQKILKDICAKHFSTHTHERLSLDELKASVYYDEIVNVYHRLGGILTTIPARVGEYDIDTPNFIIELDEENHFNRYRLSTLQSDVYNDNHNLDVELYKGYCKSYENKCCTHGKYASSDSTNKQFGKSVVDGDLKDVNRTRWKQRAFYDYIKDITSLVIGVPIIRISIYEVYKGKTIETLIKNHCEDLLIEYINMRLEKCK